MKKLAAAVFVTLVVVVLLLSFVAPSEAWSRGHGWHGGGRWHGGVRTHVFIGAGPFWWGPAYPWWYYPPYPAYMYSPAPVVIREEPSVYIQQAPPAVQRAPSAGYWYYCPSANGYYPTVPQCPEGWTKVPPRAP